MATGKAMLVIELQTPNPKYDIRNNSENPGRFSVSANSGPERWFRICCFGCGILRSPGSPPKGYCTGVAAAQ